MVRHSPTRWAQLVSRPAGAPDGARAGPALRLFCFPYAGAGASIYAGWQLPDGLPAEVWAVQPPGRENRRAEPCITDVDSLVRAYARHLLPLLDRPFAFFGHSLGALAAFELTRLLRQQRAPLPVQLFLAAHRAPDLLPKRGPVSTLSDDQFVARMWEIAGPSRSVIRDPELLLLLAPTIRSDFAACERYRYVPDAPLEAPVTCFAAVDDCELDLPEVAAWERHTFGAFQLRRYRGGHLFVRDHAHQLLAAMADDIRTL